MSSAISTKVRLKPESDVRLKPDTTDPRTTSTLEPWQFFVLAALGCATTVAVVVRGQGLVPLALLAIIIGATALVGIAAVRTFRPLVAADDDRTQMIGHRTRAALEREKALVLRTIKELEFDRAMGKLSDTDWQEMSTRLRGRAARLIRQLDAGTGYRDQIERDLQKRIGEKPAAVATPACAKCGTMNDYDAKFCKSCGAKL